MVDFIDSNGKFLRNILILTANTKIGVDAAVHVFKIWNYSPAIHTWELVGLLPLISQYFKIIDRRDGTF